MRQEEAAYWIALAHLPRWGHLKINSLIIKFFKDYSISIEEFFSLSESEWRSSYELDIKQITDLQQAKTELASNAFLAESYFNQGFEIIPITSPEYSGTLKQNLKTAHAPAVLYVKGNKKILQEKSVAIVGSRDASELALQFTDNIAKKASRDYKVVVSGFAKGVDKQALDSAIHYKGQSIIVLPQGIMTFGTGFKTYYKQIVEEDVLVLSTFFPKAPWKTELAMARNPIIYGLADEIFVAESAEKGGTWSGVVDGLRKQRKIFVRNPNPGENNANALLIAKGAIAVDFQGIEIMPTYPTENQAETARVQESDSQESLIEKICEALNGRPLSAKDLLLKLNLDWSAPKMQKFLSELDCVEPFTVKRTKLYRVKNAKEPIQIGLF
jgi:DNA processing protein